MPQLQNLVLTDRTPVTPVNLTFVPREIDGNGVGTVVNNSGTPIGEKRASISMKRRSNRFKGELRLILPVVVTETINGVSRPAVTRTSYVTVLVDFPDTSTEQERNDAIGMVSSALATNKVLVNDAFVKTEGIY